MTCKTRYLRRISVIASGVVVFCLCASLLMAKPGVVQTRDGRSIEGDITDQGDSVTISVHGIPTSIPKENIASIQYTGSIEDQYKQKLADLPKSATANDHLDLARWLLDNHAYALAMQEVSSARHIDPNNSDAITLEQTIESQMRLDRTPKPTTPTTPPSNSTPATPTQSTPTPAANTGPGNGYNAAMHRYLNVDQIFGLRLAEWDYSNDNSIRITFINDVRQKYIASVQANTADFMNLPALDQARAILDNGTHDMRKDIKLQTDPIPVATYKRSIQSIILSGCATAACHGGPSGGKFFLYGSPDSEAATYTNFYLLMKASANIGGATHLMIDRDYPEYPDKSLITGFGLPADISKLPHPEVKGVTWRPIFRNTQDPQYRTIVAWISSLVKQPQYDFTFSLDTPATAPVNRSR